MSRSYAASAQREAPIVQQEKQTLKQIEVDGLVLMKIIKHCNESLPDLVTGQLLGLDVGNTLEVTNCYPFPRQFDEKDDGGAQYQMELMKKMREVNTDNNTVGWYQSCLHGAYQTEELLATFINYEENLPKCVCLIYDPQRHLYSPMPLTAIRIQDSFTKCYSAAELTSDKLTKAGVTWRDVFQEIPIHVTNSVLASQVMLQLQPAHRFRQVELERLSQHTAPFLSKHVDKLRETMEALIVETQQQALYHRRQQRYLLAMQQRQEENQARIEAGEDPLPDDQRNQEPQQPTQLNAYLISNQVQNYVRQMDQYTGQTLQKVFFMDDLQQAEMA